MRTPDEPIVDTLVRTGTGYRARSLCVVDHQPADITVIVEGEGGFGSTVRVFDQMSLSWHLVLRADHLDYIRLPADPGRPATLEQVRALVREAPRHRGVDHPNRPPQRGTLVSTTTTRGPDPQEVGLDLRAVALDIAARGWPVFPIRPGAKQPPVFKRWPQHASTDPTRIHRWWNEDPARNVAIATGPARLCVIDLDPRHMSPPATGFADALTRLPDPVPVTWTVATPHGWHLYYQAPQTPRLPCSAGRLGDGIDTRGHGGYVIAPGSRTRHGDYTVAADHPVADLPAELAVLLTPPPPAPASRISAVASHPDAYLAAILTGEAHRVATARVHLRNHTLFRSALVLGRLVAADEITEHHARTVLADAAAVHVGVEGFTTGEAERTIANGLRYSRSRPRYLRR